MIRVAMSAAIDRPGIFGAVLMKHSKGLLFLIVAVLGFAVSATRADDWPQWLGPQRDGVWREKGILDKFPEGGPKIRWKDDIGGGYASPAVVDGKVFVHDRITAKGAKLPTNAFDQKTAVPGVERILCLNEADGKELWRKDYEVTYQLSYANGPRCTPTIHEGKVYTLGAMGNLYCFDVKDGKEVWSKDLRKEYPGSGKAPNAWWGFSASPLIDGDKLICLVGGEGSIAVAFDKNSGKELWKSLSATESGYAPPTFFGIGGNKQLIIWDPDAVNALDPQSGKLLWKYPFTVKAGLSIPTPRQTGDRLFVTSFYNGSVMLKPKGEEPEVVWKGKSNSESPRLTDGLHSIMPTPFIVDGYIYGVCSYGELRCLKAETGERVWATHAATGGESVRWGNAFLTQHEDRFFLFNEKGDLIIAKLTPKGYDEISKAHVIEPDNNMPGRKVVWTHPAYANRCAYIRNDHEIVCVSLAK
jgi:outer membrane protein assembly factor BamB